MYQFPDWQVADESAKPQVSINRKIHQLTTKNATGNGNLLIRLLCVGYIG